MGRGGSSVGVMSRRGSEAENFFSVALCQTSTFGLIPPQPPNISQMVYGVEPVIQLQKRLLLKTYPDLSFKFARGGYLDAIAARCTTPPFTLTLDGNITWDQIKRHVDAALSAAGTVSECGICCAHITRRVYCNICAQYTCTDCYIKSYWHGNGVVKCPYCNHAIGAKLPKRLVVLGVNDICDRFGVSFPEYLT
jgi:hypothetical protein